MKSLFFLFFIYFVTLASARELRCAHGEFNGPTTHKRGSSYSVLQQYDYKGKPTATNSAPIRIRADFSNLVNTPANAQYTCFSTGQTITVLGIGSYTCTDADVVTPAKLSYLNNTLIPLAIARLEATLSVIRVSSTLKVPPTCGRSDIVIQNQRNGWVNTDLLLTISAHPIDVTSHSVLAFGLGCAIDQNNRTFSGMLNFDASTLSPGDPNYLRQELFTTIHEITHVLGFNNDTFTSQGMLGKDSDNHYANNAPANNFFTMNTPTVKAYVQKHFNCPNINGAAMEDGGGQGTAGSHWEKRIYMNEYMTGSAAHNPVFSGLTLAFFSDVGFYYVNNTYEEELFWGNQKGCDFVQKSCTNWGMPDYCGDSTAATCSFDLQSKSNCALKTYTTPVPSQWSYFSNAYQGGYDDLADYCSYPLVPQDAQNAWCIDAADTQNSIFAKNAEYFSSSSRCFQNTIILNVPTGLPKSTSTCWATACLSSTNMKVFFDRYWYNCPQGSSIGVITYSGTITCPDPALVCAGAPTDNSWISFVQVIPNKGEPGTTVTIYGTNFNNQTTVASSAGPVKNLQIVSNTQLVVTLPNYNDITNPSSLLKLTMSLVVINPNGQSDVGYHSFTITILFNANLVRAIGKWFAKHWYAIIIFVLILGALGYGIYRCCKVKKQARAYDS